jgi:hypothetical protein
MPAAATDIGAGAGRSRFARIRPDLAALAGLLLLSLALYLPYAMEAGWFLDDWGVYAEQKAAGSFPDGMAACMSAIPGGRKLACVYHVTEWSLLGDARWAYHLVSIAFLVAIASLAYAISRRAGLARGWSLAVGAAIVVFPGADSTRLWPVASIGQYVIVLVLVSLATAISALGRPRDWRSIALHLASASLAVLAMATYEIAVPLVALQGLVYMAVFHNRQAFLRWMLDLGLVLLFVLYRLTLAPVENQALVAERTPGQLMSRVGTLFDGTWHTWHTVFAPGLAAIGIAAVVIVAAGATFASPSLRSRLAKWWLLLGAAAVAAAVCALVFLTAEDAYVPQISTTYNRVNLPGTIPYVLAFVAVLGLLYEMIRRWSPWAFVAPISVAVVFLGIAADQVSISTAHQNAWLSSWSSQERAIPGIRAALRDTPVDARVLGFDTPQWEQDWIPVFAQTWDFRGMIEYETDVHPDYSSPFREDVECGRLGIEQAGSLVAPYRDRAHPVYFASPSRGVAVHVTSKRQCAKRVAAWGLAPYWDVSPRY